MSGILINYGDVAIGAKEIFTADVSNESFFSNSSQILSDDVSFKNYGNPIEKYSVMLDGRTNALPTDYQRADIGYWSDYLSDENGEFENSIILELTADEKIISSGIRLSFDKNNNIYCNKLNIKWYDNEQILYEKDFYPNTADYYCENRVEYYNKVIITFYSLNMPKNRLKIKSIEFGSIIQFRASNVRKCSISQKTDPLSSKLEISTGNIILNVEPNSKHSFQNRQQLSIKNDDNLISELFIKSAKRISKWVWNIQAEDYIGVLDSVDFYGGIYNEQNAVALLVEILQKAKVPYDIDGSFSDNFVSGYIPFTTCRNALQQVLFAIGGFVVTANTSVLKILPISNVIKQTVSLNEIMQGQSVKENAKVSAINVSYHSYEPIEEEITIYDASQNEIGDQIFIKFSEPLHDIRIENGDLLNYGTNFAIINAREGCLLFGKKYKHVTNIKSRKREDIAISDAENVVSIEKATLVSKDNVDNVMERCYNYYRNSYEVNSKIISKRIKGAIYGMVKYGRKTIYGSVENKPFSALVGDNILVETEYLNSFVGTIVNQKFNINGSVMVKDTTIRGEKWD